MFAQYAARGLVEIQNIIQRILFNILCKNTVLKSLKIKVLKKNLFKDINVQINKKTKKLEILFAKFTI